MPVFPGTKIDNVADSEVNVLNPILAKNIDAIWADDFSGTSLNPNWTIVQTGTNQTIGVANSELTLTTGTTANSETIIKSVQSFKPPFRLSGILKLSQRILNQEFYLEVVDSSGNDYARLSFDNINVGAVKSITANNNITTGATITTNVNSSLYGNYDIEFLISEVYFYFRASDSNLLRALLVAKSRQTPNVDLNYFIQIRHKNIAVAASSTSLVLDKILVESLTPLAIEVIGGRGISSINQSAGITGTVAISNSIIPVESQVSFTEFALPLTANASQTGSSRDAGTYNTVRGLVQTDKDGTLYIEQSLNNSTWFLIDPITIIGSASQASKYEFKMVARYYRERYTNGAVAQTNLTVISTAFRIGA